VRPSSLLLLPLAVAAAVLARPMGVARADEPPASRWVGAPVLPAGGFDVNAVHELRLTRFKHLPDEVGDAWADGLDLAVAVSPRLTLGLGHSARARGTLDHGGGWCHDGRGQVCDRAYAGALVDARWLARRGQRGSVTALVRAGVIGLGPVRPVVRLGLSGRRWRGRWWGALEPEFQIAFGHREAGNRDQLVAPLWIGFGRRRAAGWLMTGVRGELVGFGEKFEIPFLLGGGFTYGRVRVGAEAGMPQLAGPQNTGNVRHAAIWLGATF
jgi:hypothetical protein